MGNHAKTATGHFGIGNVEPSGHFGIGNVEPSFNNAFLATVVKQNRLRAFLNQGEC